MSTRGFIVFVCIEKVVIGEREDAHFCSGGRKQLGKEGASPRSAVEESPSA